jgi:hypothetical protein
MESQTNRSGGVKQDLIVGYRLGLFDADPDKPRIRYIGRVYQPNDKDRRIIRRALANFDRMAKRKRGPKMCLGVFAVEG